MTLLVAAGERAVLAHAGHGRAYLVRDGEAHRLTEIHTLAHELAQAGLIAPEQVAHHPHRSILTRSVGTQSSVRAEVVSLHIFPGDRFLLCTDGLGDVLPGPEWVAESLAAADTERVLAGLVGFAAAEGGRDDVTAIVVEALLMEAAVSGDEESVREGGLRRQLDALRQAFLFEKLPLRYQGRVLDACDLQEVPAGRVIVEEGSAWSAYLVVVDGEFALLRPDRPGAHLGPGHALGAGTLLGGRQARATLKALSDARVLMLPGPRFRALVERTPRLGTLLLDRLARHLARQLDAATAGDAGGGVTLL